MSLAAIGLGPTELLIILAILIVFFLPGKLPEAGRKIGEVLNVIRGSSDEDNDSEGGKP